MKIITTQLNSDRPYFYLLLIGCLFISIPLYIFLSFSKPIYELISDKQKQTLPNVITLTRLLSCLLLFYPQYLIPAVLFNMSFDILDGYLARRLKKTSAYGADLDGYSDMVFHILVIMILAKLFLPEQSLWLFYYPVTLLLAQFLVATETVKLNHAYCKQSAQTTNLCLLTLLCPTYKIGIIFMACILLIYNCKRQSTIISTLFFMLFFLLTMLNTTHLFQALIILGTSNIVIQLIRSNQSNLMSFPFWKKKNYSTQM